MPVVLIVVAAAIVVGMIIVALGRGGELAKSTADFVPFGPGDITATDVALLRPPPSLYGYHIPATDQALSRIAQTMTERDVEIATLRRQLAELRSIAGADAGLGMRAFTDPAVPGAPGVPGTPEVPGGAEVAGEPGVTGTLRGPAVPGAPGGLLPSRPSMWRRELTDPQPAQDPHPAPGSYQAQDQHLAPGRHPAQDPQRVQDPWPPQAPWSAWERQSGLAAGSAAEPVAGPAAWPATGPVAGPSGEPAAGPAAEPAVKSATEPDDPSQPAAMDPAPDPFEDTDPGTSGMAW